MFLKCKAYYAIYITYISKFFFLVMLCNVNHLNGFYFGTKIGFYVDFYILKKLHRFKLLWFNFLELFLLYFVLLN